MAIMTEISASNNKKEDTPTPPSSSTANNSHQNTDIKNNNNNQGTSNNKDDKDDKDKESSNQKVKVHLVAVGSAPILKKNKFLMNRTDNFGVVISFLVKRLRLVNNVGSTNNNSGSSSSNNGVGSNDGNNKTNVNSTAASSSLFVYVNSAFVPSPTENIGDLYDCFGMKNNGELILHYALQEAWG